MQLHMHSTRRVCMAGVPSDTRAMRPHLEPHAAHQVEHVHVVERKVVAAAVDDEEVAVANLVVLRE